MDIDPNNGFVNKTGSLYVNGADVAQKLLSRWILTNSEYISGIVITLDSHPKVHIGNASYWINKEGKEPETFSVISKEALLEGTWMPKNLNPGKLEEFKEDFPDEGITIWPPHCQAGTDEGKMPDYLLTAIFDWKSGQSNSDNCLTLIKGELPDEEDYSAFTGSNSTILIKNIEKFCALYTKIQPDYIMITGQAKDYCVASTVRDLIEIIGRDFDIEDKLVYISDLLPCINPDNPSLEIYKKAGTEMTLPEFTKLIKE